MDEFTRFLADRRRFGVLIIAVIVAGSLGLWLSAAPAGETTGGLIPAPRQGFLAPAFELESLDGEGTQLSDFHGQVVVLNLWASWCPPCRAEMPAFQTIHEEYADQGLVVLGVNMTFQDNLPAAVEFVDEFGLSFPILLDRTGLVGNTYRMRALPSTFIIDREGVIREVIVGGPISQLTLESMITKILDRES